MKKKEEVKRAIGVREAERLWAAEGVENKYVFAEEISLRMAFKKETGWRSQSDDTELTVKPSNWSDYARSTVQKRKKNKHPLLWEINYTHSSQ